MRRSLQSESAFCPPAQADADEMGWLGVSVGGLRQEGICLCKTVWITDMHPVPVMHNPSQSASSMGAVPKDLCGERPVRCPIEQAGRQDLQAREDIFRRVPGSPLQPTLRTKIKVTFAIIATYKIYTR